MTGVAGPLEVTLELTPRARVDVIDVAPRLAAAWGELGGRYGKALYCSHHTTAGYLDQRLCARLGHRRERLARFVGAFQRLFPPGASYRHDRLELRNELTPEQRAREPLNADSHLTFIGSGLRNCVTYVHRPAEPVYFIDLDGTGGDGTRSRRTTVLAFNREEAVARVELQVPVSRHPIDSVNLRDPRLGLLPPLEEVLAATGVTKGRIDLALAPGEQAAGLTVNEFETLLMRHDLAEVLKDPFRFVAEKAHSALRNPRALPGRTLDYARYDLVLLLNELMDALGAGESLLERLLARMIALPAPRFLRLKRTVSLLVSDHAGSGPGGAGRIVQGTYQSPILVQWRKAEGERRRVVATIRRFR